MPVFFGQKKFTILYGKENIEYKCFNHAATLYQPLNKQGHFTSSPNNIKDRFWSSKPAATNQIKDLHGQSLFTEYTPDLNQKLESSCSSIRLFLLHISLLNYFLGQIFTTKHSTTLFLPNGSHSLYYFVSIHLHFLFLHLALNQMILLPASPDICPCLGDFLVATAGGHYWGGQRTEMLLNILQSTGRSSRTDNQSKTVPSLRDPDLDSPLHSSLFVQILTILYDLFLLFLLPWKWVLVLLSK